MRKEDVTMPRTISSAKAKEFAIPVELLKGFQKVVRFKPRDPPVAGYIMFDMEMLVSILQSGNPRIQRELARNLAKFGAAGGSMVMMG